MESRNYFHIPDEIKIQAIRNIAGDIERVLGSLVSPNADVTDEECKVRYEEILRINMTRDATQDFYRSLLTTEVDHILVLQEKTRRTVLPFLPRKE